MEPSNFVKIAAAFGGGIVVALGGALLYTALPHTRADTLQPHQAVAQAPVRQQPADPPRDATRPLAVATPPPSVEAPAAKVPRKARRIVRKEVPSPVPIAEETSPPEIASVAPPPSQAPPQVAPAAGNSGRAVNEDQYQGPQPNPDNQLVQQEPPAPRQPHVVTLAAGTSIFIRLGETVSTDHNYSGDTFRGTLDQPIISEGFIIADRGSKVLGQIVHAEKAGRIRGLSDLSLDLMEINTTDGQRVRVSTSTFDKHGSSSKGMDAAKIAGGAAFGALIGALGGGGKGAAIGSGAGAAAGAGTVLITRGKGAVIPAETQIQFRLTTPVTITEKFN